jgi:hypothetical protein
MNKSLVSISFLLVAQFISAQSEALPSSSGRWTVEQAAAWHKTHPFFAGANFIPSTACNQLEMWQAETFDPTTIDRELRYAHDLGFRTMRVFLHDLLWLNDREGLLKRMAVYLDLAEKYNIQTLFVFFDSCWDPYPKSGPQPDPRPRTHNAGWVQSPGMAVLSDHTKQQHLKPYVQGVIRHFSNDKRILAWDIWNEPDNFDGGVRNTPREPVNKPKLVLPLLKAAFEWAREIQHSQPLTSAVWRDPGNLNELDDTKRVQLTHSDIISFHCYEKPERFLVVMKSLQQLGRPLLCTEYMARVSNSKFDPLLGIMKEHKISAYCWGFVAGRTQTIYPVSSWRKVFVAEPNVWNNEILHVDGTPYRVTETDYIRKILNATAPNQ